MTRHMTNRWAGWAMLAALTAALGLAGHSAWGQEAKGPLRKAAANKAQKMRRLPPFLAKVVTDEQREKIHEIQEQYEPKIKELEEQLAALRKERDEKISAVLSAEQKKQIEEAKAAAKDAKAKLKPEKPSPKKAEATPE